MTADSPSRMRERGRPLREALRDPVNDAAVARMWHAIEARQGRARRQRGWILPAMAATVLAGLGALYAARPDPALLAGPAPEGPLLTAEKTEFVGLDTVGEGPRAQRFADGSVLEAAGETRIEGLAFTAHEVTLLLERGSVEVSVPPGGPRRWTIEAKLARVEVLGTRFSVTRSEERVEVAVSEGTVLVRSTLLPEGVRRLVAGQAVRIEDAPQAEPPKPTSSADPEAEPLGPVVPPRPSSAGGRPTSPATVVTELMRRADAARLAGDPALAELLLERVVRGSPRDPRAPLAAFTLGVIRMDRGDLPRALEAFRLSIALGAPATLQEDCYLRSVEAELRSSRPERARATSEEYRRKFPAGRHRRALAALLEEQERAPRR